MDLSLHFTIFFHGFNKNIFYLSSPYQPTYSSQLPFPVFVSKPHFVTLDPVTNRATQITPNSNKTAALQSAHQAALHQQQTTIKQIKLALLERLTLKIYVLKQFCNSAINPRCTLRTFNASHVARLSAPLVANSRKMLCTNTELYVTVASQIFTAARNICMF